MAQLHVLTAFSTINQAINNQNSADVMYLDFSKAFDSVPHSQLLFKLWQIGIVLRCYLPNQQIALCHYRWPSIGYFTSHIRCPTGKHARSTAVSNIHQRLTQLHQQLRLSLFADNAKIIRVISNLQDQLATPPGRPTQY